MRLPEILYNHFKRDERKAKKAGEITFAPSYLSACVRQTTYKKLGTEPSNPIESTSLLKMHFGTVMHDEIQKILTELGHVKSFEEWRTKEWEGLTFNYYCDGILDTPEGDTIMEIKTIYAQGFRSIEDKPKDDHVLQCLSYMKFEGIDRAIILYIGRDNGYMVQHELELIDNGRFLGVNDKVTDHLQQWNKRIEVLKLTKESIELENLPPREFTISLKRSGDKVSDYFQKDNKKYKSDWQCSYCAFKDKCWEKELKEIQNHNFYINGKFS